MTTGERNTITAAWKRAGIIRNALDDFTKHLQGPEQKKMAERLTQEQDKVVIMLADVLRHDHE